MNYHRSCFIAVCRGQILIDDSPTVGVPPFGRAGNAIQTARQKQSIGMTYGPSVGAESVSPVALRLPP